MFFFRKNKLKDASDEELIASYKQSEDNAYIGVLFDRYTQLAFLVCMKYLKNEEESRDAVMHIFERLLQDLKRYEVKQFRFWFHTILKNHCLALIEKKKRIPTTSADALDYHIEEEGEEEWMATYLPHLPAAISQLNEEQKTCIELFYLQHKSYQEIAESTGFDIKQVKSFIQNGKRNLKIHLLKKKT